MTNQDIAPIPTMEPPADLSAADEAVVMIDAALAQMMQRELVAANEVADLLLDVRSLLTK